MKKVKLLMPIVCLTTITPTVCALASCSKNKESTVEDIKVTEAEWLNAIDWLCLRKDGAQWRSTKEDDGIGLYAYQESETKKWVEYQGFGNIAVTEQLQRMDSIGFSKKDEGEVKKQVYDTSAIKKGQSFFEYSVVYDEQGQGKLTNGYVHNKSYLMEALDNFFDSFADYEEFTYDTKKHAYVYLGQYEEEGFSIVLDSKVTFGKNKLIESIDSDLRMYVIQEAAGNETETISEEIKVVLHPAYNDVKVEIEPEVLARANEHTFEMNTKTKDFRIGKISPDESKGIAGVREGMVLFLTPYVAIEKPQIDFTIESTTPGTYRPWDTAVSGIYKNGVMLKEGDDPATYDYKREDFTKITFYKPFAKTDVIQIALAPNEVEEGKGEYDDIRIELNSWN